ncbi:hypothetical protein [Treponema sp. J25]|uniref:hypothetical protein n=1 Tax=Treponema sp. J25 TaxID=2094121 RepID=UPI001052B592|nr:hypothetical protein [Treponema sp. J25]HOM24558.1 hypothetical protein [Termitinemataceae bacterium]
MNQAEIDAFWQNYARSLGEPILAHSLGCYVQGWFEGQVPLRGPLWGLLMVTKGKLHFHHFPQESWLDFLNRASGTKNPSSQEIVFTLERKNILSVEYYRPQSWWARLFSSAPPYLRIVYGDETGKEQTLVIEVDKGAEPLVTLLRPSASS